MKAKKENDVKLSDEWIRIQLYYKKSGETKDSFANKKRKGKIIRGYHYVVKSPKETWVNYPRMQAWVVENQATSQKA